MDSPERVLCIRCCNVGAENIRPKHQQWETSYDFFSTFFSLAVILPTIWGYLQVLHAAPFFLGLGLSAFSLSGLLSGPLFGHWSDRTRTTKSVVLFSNVFEIVGNFMYFIGYSKWLLLSSRLVAGVGAGAASSIFGFITQSTAPEDRANVFAAVMACRQVGLLIGPAFNIFLRLCDFHLGPFLVDKYTSPGLFMCMMWALLQLVVLLMYWDLPPEAEDKEKEVEAEEEEEEVEGVEEDKPLMGPEEPLETYSAVTPEQLEALIIPNGNAAHGSPPPSITDADPFQNFSVRNEFLREEVVILLTAQFITLFNQTALETMVTPLTQKYFNFRELENSVMYFLCGVEVIAGFFFVRWLSQKVADRVVLVVGLIICNVSCAWCLIFLAKPRGSFTWQLTEFIIGVFLQLLGLPFVAVSQVSLFSKVTAVKTQGFSQGVRWSVGGLGTILGPLWAGGLTEHLYVMLGMMLALLVLLTIMVMFSYNRLVEPCVVQHADSLEDCM
ncbi:major facilitator superfamily domain-containing protein 8-like isoform X5 [Anguilla anguilla]|uniref:major facilitator superfamily domain-containing protein 8-like isoform X5 n=1 Tax=Anguilla anguilla TaxID=7936 RepID=UPI0015B18B77|nr:major facilitator superfamily domain-containing protein 8-like isoform X5 [Anguilla anguilla]XP_035279428.1 major facilitator superfamily domain-containing protein 8-like isoform X5 [Anguilla anguilla]XP_035279429.1 major facilitator superfamily domain-containing protein 8-like isoform X5 [Anguilla anguilla]